MSVDRLVRVNELLKREIGDGLFRVVNEPGVDLGGVTVTHVVSSKDLSRARVLVSIREPAARARTLAVLRRRRADIQSLINADLMLKRTPVLQFELDPSIEEGDRVLTLLAQLAPPAEALSAGDEAAAAPSESDPAGGPDAP